MPRAKIIRDPHALIREKMTAARRRQPDYKWQKSAAQADRAHALSLSTREAMISRMTPGTKQKPGHGQSRHEIIRTNGPTKAQFAHVPVARITPSERMNVQALIALWDGKRRGHDS